MNSVFVLIHSPLVGAYTWQLVAEALRQRGYSACVPQLPSTLERSRPAWQQHAEAVIAALHDLTADQPLILVGHSGGGVLLPIVRQMMQRAVAGYLFVDADLPRNGASRLDRFATPDEADQFRQSAVDGLLPTWSEDDLREVIPNLERRRRFVAELRPLPLTVYEERLPVFAGWPDAPCSYLKLGAAYPAAVSYAQQHGWTYAELAGEHFNMLVDPASVAASLIALGVHQ